MYWKPTQLYLLTLGIEAASGFFRAVFAFFVTFFLLLLVYLVGFGLYVLVTSQFPTLATAPRPTLTPGQLLAADDSPLLAVVLIYSLFFIPLVVSLLAGFGGIALSLHAYWGYGSGRKMTRFALGARPLSQREQRQVDTVLGQIAEQARHKRQQLPGFVGMYVIESPTAQAFVIGRTLYLHSQAIRSEHLTAILAHEVAHNANNDGGVSLALRRLVLPPFYFLFADVRSFSTQRPNRPSETLGYWLFMFLSDTLLLWSAFVGGGLGVSLTSLLWADYFRQVDYLADNLAARLGFQSQLLEYLEATAVTDHSVPFMRGWQPAHELRMDRLRHPVAMRRQAGSNLLTDFTTFMKE